MDGFELRTVAVPPGGEHQYDAEEWRDVLVVVERGRVELESRAGRRHSFGRGETLWLSGLPLRAVRNPGRETAVLIAVSRRR
jgi:quercetin dioxygenase-like cupin family protein